MVVSEDHVGLSAGQAWPKYLMANVMAADANHHQMWARVTPAEAKRLPKHGHGLVHQVHMPMRMKNSAR